MPYRVLFKSGWTGLIEGEEKRVEAGEVVDVDLTTMNALIRRGIIEPVPVEEIMAEIEKKLTPKKTDKTKASKTKSQVTPPKDKMVKASNTK